MPYGSKLFETIHSTFATCASQSLQSFFDRFFPSYKGTFDTTLLLSHDQGRVGLDAVDTIGVFCV